MHDHQQRSATHRINQWPRWPAYRVVVGLPPGARRRRAHLPVSDAVIGGGHGRLVRRRVRLATAAVDLGGADVRDGSTRNDQQQVERDEQSPSGTPELVRPHGALHGGVLFVVIVTRFFVGRRRPVVGDVVSSCVGVVGVENSSKKKVDDVAGSRVIHATLGRGQKVPPSAADIRPWPHGFITVVEPIPRWPQTRSMFSCLLWCSLPSNGVPKKSDQ